MKRPTRPSTLIFPAAWVHSQANEKPSIVPTLPVLEMGDPFSAENIELFEQYTNNPKRPPPAYFPYQQAAADVPEDETPEYSFRRSEDLESHQSRYYASRSDTTEDEHTPKAFEFVIKNPRSRFINLAIFALPFLLIILAVVGIYFSAKDASNQTNHQAANTTSIPQKSASIASINRSSVVVLTTSSTSTSGFGTIVVPVTEAKSEASIANHQTSKVVPLPLKSETTAPSSFTGWEFSSPGWQNELTPFLASSTESATSSRVTKESHRPTADNFIRAEILNNKTLPLSKRRLPPSESERTDSHEMV